MKNLTSIIRSMSREERIAHSIFAVSGVAGALEFHTIMPEKNKKTSLASNLTFFYGACIGYSVGIFASGVTQLPIRGLGILSTAIIARRIYSNHSESISR